MSKCLTALLSGAIVIGAASAAHATILPFYGLYPDDTNSGKPVPAGYGDNVSSISTGSFTYRQGTEGWSSNVTADFSSTTYVWAQGLGDLTPANQTAVVYGKNGPITVTLTAAPGYTVTLFDMDLAGEKSDRTSPEITVKNQEGATLFLQENVVAPQIGHNHFSFGPGITGQTLILNIDTTGTYNGYGMSNLRFEQSVIPEPASLSLLTLGAVGLLARRRKA